jgi:Fe2+ or Zn2+ uptake regulation protein
VTAFEDDRLEQQLAQLAGRLQHSMSGHDIVIRGDCADCAKR